MRTNIFKEYYRLAKPGIIYGNLLTTVAAFLFATGWQVPYIYLGNVAILFIATAAGISLVIGSACVFNNILDRDIDARMERTRNRPLVTGTIGLRPAIAYGTALGLTGFALLAVFANLLTAFVALFGWILYVLAYGWAKRKGWWGALVGSIPGAVPIVVGYVAVTNQLDLAAFLLFLVMVVWQMPHFYGIAMHRTREYAAAGIPTLAEAKGMRAAKVQTFIFMTAFLPVSLLLFVYHYAGYAYLVIMLALSAAWLWRGAKGFRRGTDDAKWGRGVFLYSLIVLLGFSVILAISPLLP